MTSLNNSDSRFDIAVVGAGVFGAWTALNLCRAGRRVVLLDAHGPANIRASSGDESRIIRMGYGGDEIYTRSAMRSLELWQEFIVQIQRENLFHRTGVLWLAHEGDPYVFETKQTIERAGVNHEELSRSELERRYPQIDFADVSWGLLEPLSGALMARQLVEAVVAEAVKSGVTYIQDAVVSPVKVGGSRMTEIETSGRRIGASTFVFACGPWLPALFPDLLGDLIHPTRQEIFFFGIPAGELRFGPEAMPAWVDFHDLIYSIPDLDGGLKIAIDRHGPQFDPETGDRTPTEEGLQAAREHLARRLPVLRDAPLNDSRVCQYENTSNGDFLIDRHPGVENVWIVGGGSGHGFKHGPAVGEYLSGLINGGEVVAEPRFSLATKASARQRAVY